MFTETLQHIKGLDTVILAQTITRSPLHAHDHQDRGVEYLL